jgi:uncharacterized protein
MLIHDLSPADCRDVLSRVSLARLACSRDDQPYVVPVSFAYDRESNCLYGFSAIGRKIEWMRGNPRVCIEVEDIEDRFHWTTVVIVGRYEELRAAVEHQDSKQRALDLFGQRAEWWLPGAAKAGPREHPDVVIYRIQIDTITGRRAGRERS